MGAQRGASCPPYDEEVHAACLPAKLRNPSTAYVAHAPDVPSHTPVRLCPVHVQGRIASGHPQEDLMVQVNEGEGDHQGAWSPSTHEMDVRMDVQSEEMFPLDCVHEARENAKDNRVAARDVRGTQGVLGALVHVHAPIHDDAQEVVHADPIQYHSLGEVAHEGN